MTDITLQVAGCHNPAEGEFTFQTGYNGIKQAVIGELGGKGSGFYGHKGRDSENKRGGSVAENEPVTPEQRDAYVKMVARKAGYEGDIVYSNINKDNGNTCATWNNKDKKIIIYKPAFDRLPERTAESTVIHEVAHSQVAEYGRMNVVDNIIRKFDAKTSSAFSKEQIKVSEYSRDFKLQIEYEYAGHAASKAGFAKVFENANEKEAQRIMRTELAAFSFSESFAEYARVRSEDSATAIKKFPVHEQMFQEVVKSKKFKTYKQQFEFAQGVDVQDEKHYKVYLNKGFDIVPQNEAWLIKIVDGDLCEFVLVQPVSELSHDDNRHNLLELSEAELLAGLAVAEMNMSANFDLIELQGDYDTDAMICLRIPDTIREYLVEEYPFLQDKENLHITLVYLGDTRSLNLEEAWRAARAFASWQSPIKGKLQGMARFVNGQEEDPLVMTFDTHQMPNAYEALCDFLNGAGVPFHREHGFIPHVTIAYIPKDAKLPINTITPVEINFNQVYLVWNNEWFDFELTGDVNRLAGNFDNKAELGSSRDADGDGRGSGNWEHAGRKGMRGGSAGSASASTPAVNNVKPKDITETSAFKKWFGNSKVVDESGKPLLVYHGTGADFQTFDPDRIGWATGNSGHMGSGFYFSVDPVEAEDYGVLYYDKGANVIPAYLSLQNPMDMRVRANRKALFKIAEQNGTPFRGGYLGELDDGYPLSLYRLFQTYGGETVTDMLKKNGYDGVISGSEVVAFYPTQIKSKFNSGSFDPANPNILLSFGDKLLELGAGFLGLLGVSEFQVNRDDNRHAELHGGEFHKNGTDQSVHGKKGNGKKQETNLPKIWWADEVKVIDGVTVGRMKHGDIAGRWSVADEEGRSKSDWFTTPEQAAKTVSSIEAIGDFESKISGQAYETAGISKDGYIFYKKDGDKDSVVFSDWEVAKMKGNTLTHNHPSGGTFSLDDYDLFHHAKMKEIRAVGNEWTYILTAPDGYDYETNERRLRLGISAVQIRLTREGKITGDDWKVHNHLTTIEWANDVGLTYKRIKTGDNNA